jgi:predicted amidohydrolase YtcJ
MRSSPRRTIVIRGRVRTMDPSMPTAHAVVIEGAQIAAVLADADDVPARADVVDARNCCVLPAFTDAHVHLPSWAMARRSADLRRTASLGEALARVAAWIDANPHAPIVRGRGWSSEHWSGGEMPTATALNAVSGDRPVMLKSYDSHSLWLNSAALALADGDLETPGGIVERDAGGEPTGVLREEATWRYESRFPPSREDALDAVRTALPDIAAAGVVGVHDKDGHRGSLDLFEALEREGRLSLRVWQSVPAERFEDYLERYRPRAPGEGPWGIHGGFRLGYLKVFMDGTLGSRTARLLDGTGVEVTSAAQLAEIIEKGARHGLPVATHAIGDRAVREALDSFEATSQIWRPRSRHRIEHAQCVHPDDLPRFGRLDITASVQFTHATSDRDLADEIWGERAAFSYPYRSLLDAGARLAAGSDAPVEDIDPLAGVRAAVLRTSDDRPAWRPEESITPYAALAAFTHAPARLEGADKWRGRLARGFVADLVVVDRDPVQSLDTGRVRATMLGGRWIYGGEAFG